MNELALFAGIGGGILGTQLLGHRCICAVENDPHAQSVLLARQNNGMLPTFPIWDDVTTFDGKPWRGIVDIVSGGFPCQDISSSGQGAGITGEQSGLWKHMFRIIGDIQPKFAFIENSPSYEPVGWEPSSKTLPASGMMRSGALSERGRLVRPTKEIECGYLPTPNKSDYIQRKTSASWKAKGRVNFVLSNPEITGIPGGRINPEWSEWLMGIPIGWTGLREQEMPKYQEWLDLHLKS